MSQVRLKSLAQKTVLQTEKVSKKIGVCEQSQCGGTLKKKVPPNQADETECAHLQVMGRGLHYFRRNLNALFPFVPADQKRVLVLLNCSFWFIFGW